MDLVKQTPRKALNKAFLKVKPNRSAITAFKSHLLDVIDKINESESEEYHKNLVSRFLTDTYYGKNHFINTKGRNDLVIHNGKDAKSTVGVIIEAKSPTNKTEMLKVENINTKAFQELVLYYLRERITVSNLEIKYLIVSNIYEWFIFDAGQFEKHFVKNKNLVKQFKDFEEDRLSGTTTDFFYSGIAKPAIESIKGEISFTHFNISDYEKPLRNSDKEDDNKLIELYKLLSPEHLLKLPFTNDSNSLDKAFYTELLHIIGLEEVKDNSKKLIQRKEKGKSDSASLIENTISQLRDLDKLSRLKDPQKFGKTHEDRYFNVALELVISWVNRILFLKLLEAQQVKYQKGDKAFSFLNLQKIPDYDELNCLFFSVLAKKAEERSDEIKNVFSKVPYLNSSLFEPTELEQDMLFISNLRDERKLPVISSTVLKDRSGKKSKGELNTLEYLFAFLDAYDFSSEGSEDIQEDNKTLINASVLGLIFEKINGYKDGSFFTPGFITMYMCRETIRRTVLQKFKEIKGWDCKDLKDLYDIIDDKKAANEIINSLKICDPAVGSGHFLVSALNEIIAIKSELKILLDRDGKTLRDYHVEVVNDELIITDEDGHFFEYTPGNMERQRVQEALFHEKQNIIENCLFGVDINHNSVKICRLRLWIELLKNAYYKADTNFTELETLPNIDINIKCGNSLISRFSLDVDLKQALRKSKWTIYSYRRAVQSYREAKTKEEKHGMEKLINTVKSDFRMEIHSNDPKVKRLRKLDGELYELINQMELFDLTPKEQKARDKNREKLNKEIDKLRTEIEDIKSNKIYENAFEWRFEFPEVLNNEGDFVGFDVIIGNPPYIYRNFDFTQLKSYFKENYLSNEGNFDLYKFFIERIYHILKVDGIASYIVPNTFLSAKTYYKLRNFLISNFKIRELYDLGLNVFDGVTVENIIFSLVKSLKFKNNSVSIKIDRQKIKERYNPIEHYTIPLDKLFAREKTFNIYLNTTIDDLIQKLRQNTQTLGELAYCTVGINTGYIKTELICATKLDDSYHKVLNGKDIGIYSINWPGEWIKYDKDFVNSFGKLGRTLPPERIFTEEKILVQRTRRGLARKLVCTYDDNKYYNLNRISNIVTTQKDVALKYILALLNSTVLDFYFNKVFNEYEVKPLHLSLLPIKIISQEFQQPFIWVVDKILEAKKADPNSDTSTLESQIDQLVYKLYDLTDEEIKIVEGK